MSKKPFDTRQLLLKTNRPFATQFGKYELVFTPHLLGSMIDVRSKEKDEFCGTYLMADAPTEFIVALGAAAKKLNKKTS